MDQREAGKARGREFSGGRITMNLKNDGVKNARSERVFAAEVGAQVARKLRARKSGQGVWFGLGMMGLIGWSVVVPTLLGAALGSWLDKHHPGERSWTLALLVAGLGLGCLNAWHWVAQENRAMADDEETNHE